MAKKRNTKPLIEEADKLVDRETGATRGAPWWLWTLVVELVMMLAVVLFFLLAR